jgi:hypothetical protein
MRGIFREKFTVEQVISGQVSEFAKIIMRHSYGGILNSENEISDLTHPVVFNLISLTKGGCLSIF